MYAIMELRNKQFCVEKDQLLQVNRLRENPGDEIVVDKVLLVSDNENPVIGQPEVPNAKIVCEVLRHFRGEKKVSYKYKRRGSY